MLYGPNSNTGHMSVTVGVENAVSAALKLIAPLLEGRATKLAIRREAYEEWATSVQKASKNRVFNREICTNVSPFLDKCGKSSISVEVVCFRDRLEWNDLSVVSVTLLVASDVSKLE